MQNVYRHSTCRHFTCRLIVNRNVLHFVDTLSIFMRQRSRIVIHVVLVHVESSTCKAVHVEDDMQSFLHVESCTCHLLHVDTCRKFCMQSSTCRQCGRCFSLFRNVSFSDIENTHTCNVKHTLTTHYSRITYNCCDLITYSTTLAYILKNFAQTVKRCEHVQVLASDRNGHFRISTL